MKQIVVKLGALRAVQDWIAEDEDGNVIQSGRADPACLHYPYTEGLARYQDEVKKRVEKALSDG